MNLFLCRSEDDERVKDQGVVRQKQSLYRSQRGGGGGGQKGVGVVKRPIVSPESRDKNYILTPDGMSPSGVFEKVFYLEKGSRP